MSYTHVLKGKDEMRIIISPAKKMNIETDLLEWKSLPQFLSEAEKLAEYLKSLCYEELKTIWKCNDKIAALNYERLQTMHLKKTLLRQSYHMRGCNISTWHHRLWKVTSFVI